MDTTLLACTAAEAKAYLAAGRPYADRTDEALRHDLEAKPLPMIHYRGDPAELTGTVWARCELVLRANDEVTQVIDLTEVSSAS